MWLDKNASKVKDKSRFFTEKAISEYAFSLSRKYPELIQKERKSAFVDFAKAVQTDADSVNANYVYGKYLNLDERFDDAVPFLKKAAQLSPNVLEIRREFWKSLQGQINKTDEQKNAELVTALNAFLIARNKSPEALLIVSKKFDELKNNEKRDFYENQILQKYPNTKFDEEVLYNRILRVYQEAYKGVDTVKARELINKTEGVAGRENTEIKEIDEFNRCNREARSKRESLDWDYINRPLHFDNKKLGFVYTDLSRQVAEDKDVTDEQLTKLIEGMFKYNNYDFVSVNSEIAEILIDGRNVRPSSKLNDKTEKYARAGIVEAEEKTKKISAYSAKVLRAKSINTLAEVLTKNDKLDEAEQLLLKVQELVAGNNSNDIELNILSKSVNYNFAELYEAKKDYDKAEAYYLKGVENPNYIVGSLKELYAKRNGNLDGFDKYFAVVKDKINLKRREGILASRSKEPKDAVPFNLKTIDGKMISFNELKGKIIVVNVWGTWCLPCVSELPQLQQLYKKYQNDKNTLILTIDFGDELSAVQKFIAGKKYEFPVMLDDGYFEKTKPFAAKDLVFPTTFFIDKNGKAAFVKQGESNYLLEEFSWRIEALKEDKDN